MQLLWFLPSIAYGVMLAVTSGNYLLLVSTVLSGMAMLLVRWRISRQPKLGSETQLRILGNRIWLDDYRLPRGSAFWTREQFDFVFERLAVKTTEVKEYCEQFVNRQFQKLSPLSALIGFNQNELVRVSLEADGPHTIIVGPTGSGKTELLKNVIRDLTQSSPTAEFVLIDFKGGSGLSQFEGRARELVTDQNLDAAINCLEQLKQELKERESESDCQPLVIAIDELAHLLAEVKNAEAVLASIAARGRSARMHLILTNQNLVGIPRALLSNLKLRILVGQHDPVDAALLGQASKAIPAPDTHYRLTQAQIVGHGQAGKAFWFTGSRPALLPTTAQEVSEPEPLQHWSPVPRARLDQVPVRRRHGRRRANRGWPALAHKAVSRWSGQR
jgi:energy-coupling factor transporter ATP-binding protein EcfA2